MVLVADALAYVNGWEIRVRADGGFGVYDLHGLVAGPFGSREKALEAAINLPKPAPKLRSSNAEQT